MAENMTEDRRIYHPHRKDGLDRNLRRLNEADYLAGSRCTCDDCLLKYEDSRKHLRSIELCLGGRK